jgi:hypothetical protein
MLEALCRQSSTTLDIVHAEDGPPITKRTSGLGDISYPSNPNVILGRALATFVTRVEYPTRLD